jgi:hypothetical protein
MPDKPIYSITDIIYLRESAVLGFIESYRVDGIKYDNETGQWIYQIAIRSRGPSVSTVIDHNDLREHHEILMFREDELVTFCEALELAIQNTTERLNYLTSLRAKC